MINALEDEETDVLTKKVNMNDPKDYDKKFKHLTPHIYRRRQLNDLC